MRHARQLFLCALLGAALVATSAQAMQLAVPSRTLQIGDSGSDVRLLQELLNRSPDTEVAQSGSGSPGHETDYFGALTQSAVERFQRKYAEQILTPLGLAAPTGYVGAATLAELGIVAGQPSLSQQRAASPGASSTKVSQNSASAQATYVSSQGAASPPLMLPPLPAPEPLTPGMAVPAGVNPNTINLDYAIAVVDALGKQRGYDPNTLAKIEAAMRASAATTTNYAQKFFGSAFSSGVSRKNSSTFVSAAAQLFSPLLSFFGLNNIARAAALPAIPFGTNAVLSILPCTCSVDVLDVFIVPLPPSFAWALSYVPGTQLFASYHVSDPKQAALGFYTVAQTCFEYIGVGCAPVPNYGTMSPELGSSPI